MNAKLFLFKLFLIACLADFVSAGTISKKEFVELLIQRHPFLNKEMLSVDIEREDRASLGGEQDWILKISSGVSHDETNSSLSEFEKNDYFQFKTVLDKNFWKTGGALSTWYLSNYQKVENGFSRSNYQNQIGVRYIHPLMQNKKGFLDKLQYNLKKYDIDYSLVISQENIESFLKDHVNKYIDWIYLNEQYNIIQDRLNLSKQELSRSEEKRKTNLVDEVDVIRARDTVLIVEQNSLMIKAQLDALRAELAILTQSPDLISAMPEESIYNKRSLIDFDVQEKSLLENSRIIKPLDSQIDKLKLLKQGFLEENKSNLDFIAEVSLKEFDDDYQGSFAMQRPYSFIGLEFKKNLEKTEVDALLRKVDYQISQINLQKEEVVLSLRSLFSYLRVQIESYDDILSLNQKHIEMAKQRTAEEIKHYNQGRGDYSFVIQSQDNEQNAKLTYAENAASYQKLILLYDELLDKLYL